MAQIADYLHETGASGDRHSPGPDEVRRQLRNILESPVFHGSKRCKQFLEYICERSLAGEADTLKERTIAVEVFGRRPQSDLGEDTIVRVGAREVRKRLAQYYVTPEGVAAEIHIDLLPGSYAPEFRYTAAIQEDSARSHAIPAVTETADAATVEAPRRFRIGNPVVIAGIALLAVIAIVGALKWTSGGESDTAFGRFWAPVLSSSDPLLLAVASPIVYHPSLRATLLSEANQPALKLPLQRPLQVPADQLDGSDMVPITNQYVGYGDMIVATEVASMLGRRSRSVRVRLASGIQFADLRQSQTLLIGAITNRWTMELQQAWRFQFNSNPGHETVIVDTRPSPPGVHRQWRVPSQPDGSTPEDYTLISRIRDSVTGNLLIVAAGVKHYGTEAAGRLLADPTQLSGVLEKLPRGWEDRNLQVVLHTKVIGNTPSQPDVVAWHVW